MKTPAAFKQSPLSMALLIFVAFLYSCDDPPPLADFDTDNTSPEIGDQITLRDKSTETPDSWEWTLTPDNYEFLDGTTSSSQDPVLKFDAAGSYTVTLTATNPAGSDTESKTDYITVLNDQSPVVKVYSPGLEDNLLGDKPERDVRVYLPPEYFENPSKHYPVVYLLHGFLCDHNSWWEGEWFGLEIDIEEILNDLIHEGMIAPMIVVAPDSKNRYSGSKYANSSTAGLWENFITQDVISYIDAHFRTLPVRESRGIAGLSMGGNGTFKMAMKHPELFGTLYSNSAGVLTFESVYMGSRKQDLISASQLKSLTPGDIFIYPVPVLSCAADAPAYAPNPDAPPFYGDFPITENGDLIEDTWAQWLKHDPYTMLSTYGNNLKQLKILLDCGDSDEFKGSNILFAERLTELGIEHTFEIYSGGHFDQAGVRFASAGFPFLSENLTHE